MMIYKVLEKGSLVRSNGIVGIVSRFLIILDFPPSIIKKIKTTKNVE